MSDLLDISDVTVRFGGVVAVDRVSLRLEAGRLYGLIGPNGSGKTTLLNAISGLVRPTHGSITFDGVDYTHAPSYRRTRAGIARTFQLIRLVPSLTVRENVMLGADHVLNPKRHWHKFATRPFYRSAPEVVEAADHAIERVGLKAHAYAYPGELSYGTQRRVEVARSIAASPRLLLFDEPVAGMSRQERNELANITRSLRDEGLTLLVIEHDMRMMQEMCDHLFVMDFGRCIASGLPRETAALPIVRTAYLGTTDDDA